MSRILLTGAAGGIGKIMRKKLKGWKDILRVSDIADLGEADKQAVEPSKRASKTSFLVRTAGTPFVSVVG